MWKRHTRNLDALEGSITSDRRAQKVVKHPAVRRAQKNKAKIQTHKQKTTATKKAISGIIQRTSVGGNI